MEYPETRRDDLVETIHGVDVPDPYRWLEDDEAAEVADWVERQQAFTEAYLARIPQREQIRQRLAEIWDYPKFGVPWHRGERWFQMRNEGLQEQSVMWTMPSAGGEGRVLLDPATLSEDGTVSLAGTALSEDGALLAYATSDGGSDWMTWRVRDVDSGQDLPDEVPWAKFAGAAWTHDLAGFFYGAYDPPTEGRALTERNENHQLRFHRLGAGNGQETLVYARPDEPEWGFSPWITEDGRWLVVTVWQGTEPRSRIHLARLDEGTPPEKVQITPWLDDFDAEYDVIGNDGDTLFVQTDLDAPGGRVLAIDANDPTVRTEILPEDPNPLLALRYVGGRFLVVRMVHAVHRLAIHDRDGRQLSKVTLPGMASVGEVTGRQSDTAVHLSLSSFTSSPGIFRLDTKDQVLVEVRSPARRAPHVETEQVFVDSTDGAKVPLFVVRPADVANDGTTPVILYGYGGFNIPLSPEFRLWWTVWLERGGAIAVGCFRGGGEYGRAWHDAGRLADKPHTFDDALACARWLGSCPWTQPSRICLTGGSNGGLTAAATMLREPEAFGACIPEVGVLDLLRFHKFTIGWGWTSDYGDPDDPKDFPLIHAMSPLHNLEEGRAYPPTMIMTADHDDRVVPAHSFKFAAAMQRAQGARENPVLARIDIRAGHGAGTPTSKLIDARADVMAFLEHVMRRD